MSGLRISPDLELPIDVVTEATAIVATRGAGKTSASVVIVEEGFAAGVQTVLFDRTGVYWGLRSNAKGTGPGLPIYVLGGAHHDVPLEPTAGSMVADLVVDSGHSFVLDLSDFSKGEATRFAADFLDRIYDRKARSRSTTLLVLDEAHFYAPQTPRGGFKGDGARLMGAMEDCVGLGRSRGLGVILTTQRTQSLNKAVLDLIETLVVMRMLSVRARTAVKDWIQEKNEDDELGVIASLKNLPTGTAWVWSPLRGILQKVEIRRIRTFDSYATPQPGQTRVEPKARQELDLTALGERIAATVERAKADDPKHLRTEIARLTRELTAAQETAAPEPRVEIVHVPVITAEVLSDFRAGAFDLVALLTTIREALEHLAAQPVPAAGIQDSLPSRRRADAGTPDVAIQQPGRAAAPARPRPSTRASTPTAGQGTPSMGKTERAVLTVLAEHGASTNDQIALLAGYSKKASTVSAALSKLRKAAFVTDGQPCEATSAGLDWLGEYEPLPTGQALIDFWRARFGKTEQAVLDAFLELFPDQADHATVCEITGYSPTASTVSAAASKLRKVGVFDGWQLSPQFIQGAGL